ncbi:MAG: hypothetical protein KA445_04950 [Sediminibacterium sp.]|nr:hypothetical protein [Sediminibacterium sp.]
MKLNKIRFLHISLIVIIFFNSCKKEEIQVQGVKFLGKFQQFEIFKNQVHNWYDSSISTNQKVNNQESKVPLSYSDNPNDIIPPIINWDKAFLNFDSSNVKSISIPLTFNLKNGEYLQLVATSKHDKLSGYLIKQIPDSGYFKENFDVLSFTGYTGAIIIYDLNGRFLKKITLINGGVFDPRPRKNLNAFSIYNSTYDPIIYYDLITVYVYSSNYYKSDWNSFSGTSGVISIDNYYNSTSVIAGGNTISNSTLLEFVNLSNGFCVFGSLGYLGSIVGGDPDIDTYIRSWAEMKNISLNQMKVNLTNNESFWPNMKESIAFLRANFDVILLNKVDNILNTVKQNIPICTFIVWGDGTGHCVVVRWDSVANSLYYYDSLDESKIYFSTNDDVFSKMKLFYAVKAPKS